MKQIYKNQIVFFIFPCLLVSSQWAFSQTIPKYIFQHEDINGYIGSVVFSHDNTKLLTTGGRHAIMWDLKSGSKIMILPEDSGLGPIDFSSDDKRIVTASNKHAMISIWDAHTSAEIKSIQGEIDAIRVQPPENYTSVTFSPDGKYILCGDTYDQLYVLDIVQEKIVQKISGLSGWYVRNIQFFPDGKRIVVNQSVVSLESGEIIKDFGIPIYLSSDGKDLYVSSPGGMIDDYYSYIILVLDPNTFEKKKEYPPFTSRADIESNLAISPLGNLVVVSPKEQKTGVENEIPRIINLESNEIVRTLSITGKQDQTFDLVKFSRDGKLLACIKGDTAYIYDISDLASGVKDAEQFDQQ